MSNRVIERAVNPVIHGGDGVNMNKAGKKKPSTKF